MAERSPGPLSFTPVLSTCRCTDPLAGPDLDSTPSAQATAEAVHQTT
jgi:hypothetical protein